MKKLNIPQIVVCFLLAFFLLTLWAYQNGDIGMSEEAMCREMAECFRDGFAQPSYATTGDIGDTMAVFLGYTPDRKNMDVDIYVKRKGSIGWFFRYSNSTTAATGQIDRVCRLELEGNEEYALICAGLEAIDRIEIEISEDTCRTIRPEAGGMAAYIMKKGWLVTIYDVDGDVVEPDGSAL